MTLVPVMLVLSSPLLGLNQPESAFPELAPAPAMSLALPSPLSPAPQDAPTGPEAQDWEIMLGGTGSNNQDFDAGGFSASGSFGYFFSDRSEIGVRQNVGYSDFGSSVWNGSTRFFYDYNFGSGAWRPFLGANFGWVYGDTVNETLAAAPEGGLKWFLHDKAFLFVLAEYQFFFDSSSDFDDGFNDGSFVYSLGVGLLN